MAYVLKYIVMDEAADWSGQILPPRTIEYLFAGGVVSIALRNLATAASEALYD